MDTPVTLSTHLTRSWQMMRGKTRVLLLGIAAVAFLSMLMQLVIGDRVGTEAAKQVRNLLGEKRYQEMVSQMRISSGDPGVHWQDFSKQVGDEVTAALEAMNPTQRQTFVLNALRESLRDLFPTLIIFLPLFALLLTWSRTFFFVLALRPESDFAASIALTTRKFLPMVGVVIGVFLTSLAWLPAFCFLLIAFSPLFVFLLPFAFIPPVILGPRLALAPVLYLQGAGIVASIEESYRRSRGFWGKIVGNVAVAALLSGLVLWFFLSVTDIAALVLSLSLVLLILYWLRQVFTFGAAAYRTFFLADLAEEVLRRGKRTRSSV